MDTSIDTQLVLQIQTHFNKWIPLCQCVAFIFSGYSVYMVLLIRLLLFQEYYYFFLVTISDLYIIILKNYFERARPYAHSEITQWDLLSLNKYHLFQIFKSLFNIVEIN